MKYDITTIIEKRKSLSCVHICKFLNKILANEIQLYRYIFQNIRHLGQVRIILGKYD